jgi:hypothetical protein
VSKTSGRVVGDIEDNRMGIVCDRRCPNNIESGAMVNYHRYKFKNVEHHGG